MHLDPNPNPNPNKMAETFQLVSLASSAGLLLTSLLDDSLMAGNDIYSAASGSYSKVRSCRVALRSDASLMPP